VLGELDADVIALQEVLRLPGGTREHDQARFLADELGYHCQFGENRRLRGGAYGNAVLSRFPIALAKNYDLTWRGRERRGCLRADLEVGGALLHVFNVHLGTGFLERRHQGRHLTGGAILHASDLHGPRVVVGDFNEWTRGLATRLMAGHFESVDVRLHLRRTRTYPGVFPLLHLDHFYYDRTLRLERFALHRTRTALMASDHLPMVAEFSTTAD
jgi:endonuclease/exonuclease/phosphatase family metal-dependent hydrolase